MLIHTLILDSLREWQRSGLGKTQAACTILQLGMTPFLITGLTPSMSTVNVNVTRWEVRRQTVISRKKKSSSVEKAFLFRIIMISRLIPKFSIGAKFQGATKKHRFGILINKNGEFRNLSKKIRPRTYNFVTRNDSLMSDVRGSGSVWFNRLIVDLLNRMERPCWKLNFLNEGPRSRLLNVSTN